MAGRRRVQIMPDTPRLNHREALGSVMVLAGLGFFVVVFIVLFPVLTNPSGAYDKWFPQDAAEEPIIIEEQPEIVVPSTVAPTTAAPSAIGDPLGSSFNPEGQVGEVLGLDAFGDDISTSLEGAVGEVGDEITDTLDSALGSIGATVRGGVVVMLFSFAALAATIVAWRTARIGVMLLIQDPHAGSRHRATDQDDVEDDRPSRRALEAA